MGPRRAVFGGLSVGALACLFLSVEVHYPHPPSSDFGQWRPLVSDTTLETPKKAVFAASGLNLDYRARAPITNLTKDDVPWSWQRLVAAFDLIPPSSYDALANHVTDVDTVCLISVKPPSTESLLALDDDAVFTVFHVDPNEELVEVHSPRLRWVRSRTLAGLLAHVERLAVEEADLTSCRVTLLTAATLSPVFEAVVRYFTSMDQAVAIDAIDNRRPRVLFHQGTAGTRYYLTGKQVANATENTALAMGLRDVMQGSFRRVDVAPYRHVLRTVHAKPIDTNPLVSNATKRALLSTDAVSTTQAQVLLALAEVGGVSHVCLVTRGHTRSMLWMLRHPTARFSALQLNGSINMVDDLDEIGSGFASTACPTQQHWDGRRLFVTHNATLFGEVQKECDITVLDSPPSWLDRDWSIVQQASTKSVSVVVILGVSSARALSLGRALFALPPPFNISMVQPHSASLRESAFAFAVRDTLAFPRWTPHYVAISPPSCSLNESLVLRRDALSHGPAYDHEHEWHIHRWKTVTPTGLHIFNNTLAHLTGGGLAFERARAAAWTNTTPPTLPRSCGNGQVIPEWMSNFLYLDRLDYFLPQGPVMWVNIRNHGDVAMLDTTADRVIYHASNIVCSCRLWPEGQSWVNEYGLRVNRAVAFLQFKDDMESVMVPESPSKRYFWGGGLFQQHFNSHGQQELLELLSRFYAYCNGDDECVRNTPLLLPDKSVAIAFRHIMSFFERVLPELNIFYFKPKVLYRTPADSQTIVPQLESHPDQTPARAAFVSRVLWPKVQTYFARIKMELPKPDRVVVMKVRRSDSNSPLRSFDVTEAFRERMTASGFTWVDDVMPREQRMWYINHASVVVTTFGGTRAILEELFAGEYRRGRWLRMVVLLHSSYNNEDPPNERELASLHSNQTSRRTFVPGAAYEHSHHVRYSVVRIPRDDLSLFDVSLLGAHF